MITKNNFWNLLVKIANGTNTPEEWGKYAVNHYENQEIENARAELVRQVNGFITEDEKKYL